MQRNFVGLIWEISRKLFLQCFTCRRTFSGSQVTAETPPNKNRLLRSLKGLSPAFSVTVTLFLLIREHGLCDANASWFRLHVHFLCDATALPAIESLIVLFPFFILNIESSFKHVYDKNMWISNKHFLVLFLR